MSIERLEKLLALSPSPNEHEAAAAALKLCALLIERGGIKALAKNRRKPTQYELYVQANRAARAEERAMSRRRRPSPNR